jgi:hypothetical protein
VIADVHLHTRRQIELHPPLDVAETAMAPKNERQTGWHCADDWMPHSNYDQQQSY